MVETNEVPPTPRDAAEDDRPREEDMRTEGTQDSGTDKVMEGQDTTEAQEQHIHLVLPRPHEAAPLNGMEPHEEREPRQDNANILKRALQSNMEEEATPRSTRFEDPYAGDQMAGCDWEEAEDFKECDMENPEQNTSTIWSAPVIVTAKKPVDMWMGPPTLSQRVRNVPAAPGEHNGRRLSYE